MLALLAAGCQKKENQPAPRKAEDPDWIKLELPDNVWSEDVGDNAYAITGDIERTLLVATTTHVYATTDQGKTWQVSHDFQGPLAGLLHRNDTVFALPFFGRNSQGEKIALHATKFTTDFGKTWFHTSITSRLYYAYRDLVIPIGRTAAAGVAYQIKENTAPGSSSRLIASDLLRSTGGGQTAVRLPGRHYLMNLHLDAQNRLYVAASGLRFDPSTGEAINPTVGRRAVVYVSRRPLP
ncbi:beta propeller repeat protein [Hymenobacter weizhouensis]|uniref:hypothetical protein n=1 Tax=Hymenobacter sp. YIM 151500-1 TaxID=2987689 RepID=UPI00222766CD|nr:hypothetical protein [Hymenobacter sp. YIM 151500-1]UYZ63700.1 hypothetical protein OIS53_02385 [Hymenobacter sp. YIM 151500-1]